MKTHALHIETDITTYIKKNRSKVKDFSTNDTVITTLLLVLMLNNCNTSQNVLYCLSCMLHNTHQQWPPSPILAANHLCWCELSLMFSISQIHVCVSKSNKYLLEFSTSKTFSFKKDMGICQRSDPIPRQDEYWIFVLHKEQLLYTCTLTLPIVLLFQLGAYMCIQMNIHNFMILHVHLLVTAKLSLNTIQLRTLLQVLDNNNMSIKC